MKPTPLLTISLILFALLIGTGGTLAQSRQSNPEESPQAASPHSFEHLFLFSAEQEAEETPWFQSNTVVDAAGGMHTTFFTNKHIYYATCPVNCGELTQWTITPIAELGLYHSAAHPTLALNASGQPRLMGFNGFYYIYAECDMDCNQSDSWSMVQLGLPMSIMVSYPTNGRYFTLDSLGHPRYMAPHYFGTQYFFCDTNCTDLTNWEFAILSDDSRLQDIQLVFNNANQPRMLGIASNLEYNYMSLVYAQCDTNCEQSDNWHYATLATEVGASTRYPTYSLRLDAAGRPRVAFYKATGDEVIHYMWSNTNFTNLASWSDYELARPAADRRTLDLAIDSQGRPSIVYATSSYDLRYLGCVSDCESQTHIWTEQDIETGIELQSSEPIPPDAGCESATWWLDGYPSMALDGAAKPHISYHVYHAQVCGGIVAYDAGAVRFASAVGGVTAPDYQVYLPFARK